MPFSNQWVLITGASSGIGMGFAKALAKDKANLILVARRKDRLEILAKELLAQYQIEIDVIPMDLSNVNGPKELYELVHQKNRSISLLVNNAGLGAYGLLNETSVEQNEKVVLVNVFALTMLSRLFLTDLLQNQGGIINVGSTAGFQPLPMMATYGATKAYVMSFTEALWAEYHTKGLKLVNVCPGPVDTEFSQAMNSKKRPKLGKRDTVENVVDSALKALSTNRLTICPGPFRNYFLAQVSRFFPRKWIALIAKQVMKPE